MPVFVMFQSTRPRGARHRYEVVQGSLDCFNPRAREGRDMVSQWRVDEMRGFNPRAREGRDAGPATASMCGVLFQSTRPRGARRYVNRAWGRFLYVSIHAPARGATLTLAGRLLIFSVSIHAPARGATFHGRRNY